MLYVKISGVHPALDGDYALDGASFTNRELRTIKQMSGVRAGELMGAFKAGDNDLLVAFATIALQRAKKLFDEEALWEADGGAITFEEHAEEGDAGPPDQSTSEKSGGESVPSGEGSSNGGEPSPAMSSPSSSGSPGSDTGAPSDHLTSPA